MTADAQQQRTALQRLQQAYVALEKMEARLERSERSRTEPLAVVGMACRFPSGADHPDALWQLVLSGTDAIGEVPRDRWDHDALYDSDPEAPGKIHTRSGGFLENISGFDARFWNITPREAVSLDPQHRLLLEVCWEALENAAIRASSLTGTRTGVFVGLSTFDYILLQTSRASYEQIDPYLVTGGFPCMAAGRIAYTLGLNGPALSVDTACSSALVAVHLACRSLRLGECDVALAGGVNLMLTPHLSINFSKARMLSPDGRCKTFDAAANGYVRGEGCGVVALKRLSDAEAAGDRIFAVIRGSAVNHDGVSAGITVPNGQSQVAVLRQALADARVDPNQVGFLESHGTGTSLGDPLELEAIGAVFGGSRARPLPVGAIKTNIGHTEAAAGIAGLLKALYAVHHGVIPPNLHFNTPNPKVAWDRMAVEVPTVRTTFGGAEGEARIAGVSSFGASGTNAHVVVEAYVKNPAPIARSEPDQGSPYVLALSAKSAEALSALAQRFADHLAAHPELDPGDLCFSANTGRAQFEHRLAVIGVSTADLRDKLAAAARGDAVAGVVRGEATKKARPVFLFTGQGAQFPGMGRELYDSEPVFRGAIDRCDAILRDTLERPLLDCMFPPAGTDAAAIHRTENAQPALFALEYATAKLLEHYGVRPDAVLGHSVGEYVAACVAGVFSLEDGLRLIAVRGRLMGSLPAGGAMASALGDASKVHEAILPYHDTLAVAAYNGPDQIVISGREDTLAQVRANLAEAHGVRTLPLTVSHAFHSPLMDPILDDFARAAKAVSFAPPKLRLASNRSGALAGAELADPHYWVEHIRRPVHFADGITALHELGYDLFLEVGPKPVLCGMGRRCLADPAAATWIATQQPTQQRLAFLTGLAQLYVFGAAIDWLAQHHGVTPRKLPLPTYPFQRQPYWVRLARGGAPLHTYGAPIESPLLGQRLRMAASEEVRFEAQLSHDRPEFLADHVIHGALVVPATAFVEMALSAAARVLGVRQVVAQQIQIGNPLVLQQNTARICQTVVTPASAPAHPGEISFRIFSRDSEAGHAAPWTLHCDGKAQAATTVDVGDTLAAARARCTAPVDIDTLYRHFRANGLQFGPAFTAVKEVWTGRSESLGRVVLAKTLTADQGIYLLHPAMLDACFQVAGPLLFRLLKEHNYLPVSLGEVRLLRAHDAVVFSHARMEPLPESGVPPELVSVDYTIFGSGGDVIAHINGLRFRKTDSRSILRGRERERDKSLYQIEWRALAASPAPSPEHGKRAWILFGDRSGVGDRLAQALGEGDGDVRWVVPAQSYRRDETGRRFELNPAEPAHLKQLVMDLADSAPDPWEVVHLWSLDIAGPGEQEPAETQSLGCGSVLHLVQALMTQGRRAKIWLLTRGAQAVGGAASPPDPFQATLWGIGPTLGLEHPELSPVLIDLDSTDSAAIGLADLIARGTDEDRLALRDGALWSQRLTRLDSDALPEEAAPVTAASSYLISGGFGALGLRIAQWLASRGARNLVLVGRSEPGAATQHALDRLRADGVRIQPFFLDIANLDEVARMFREVAETMPAVRGIVHAAGVLDDRTLLKLEWASFQRVLAPKLAGAWNLHRASASIPLDFFLCFSSAAVVLGSPGQAHYAAANSFLDALVHLRRAQGLPGLSIQWGPWAGGGMATEVGGSFQSEWRDLGLNMLQPERALRQMGRLITAGVGHAVVLEVAWSQFMSKRYRGGPPPFFMAMAQESRVSASAPGRTTGSFRAELESSPVEKRRSALAQHIRAIVASVMAAEGSDPIEPRGRLMDEGLDSLMAMEVRNRLERDLGVTLGSTLLFDYPTLEALERHLVEEVMPRSLFDVEAPRAAPVTRARPRRQGTYGDLDLDNIPADLGDDQVVATLIAELKAIEEERA
jgi:acyl transferase domain-containing protein/acyl carrier protein